jgi:protoheme IX farnesyltransferase
MHEASRNPGRASLRGILVRAPHLTRLRLSGLVGFSALTGYVAAAGQLTVRALPPALACLLLAAGASALNQCQERDLDRRMQRTHARPLAAREVPLVFAVALALALIAAGLALLGFLGGWRPVVAGAAALLWYHGVYTPLKRRTAFAAVPGAVVGALGPAIGWLCAGRDPREPALLALMVLFYLWQVPHFWLLALRHVADFRASGLPSAASALSPAGLGRVTFVWTVAAATAGMLLPLFGMIRSPGLYLVLGAASLGLGIVAAGLLRFREGNDRLLRRSFAGINLYLLAAMILLLADRGLNR